MPPVDYLSEAVTVRVAPEAVRGTSSATGWQALQVDVGGVSGFRRNMTDVERDIHSVNATMEKGDHVSYGVSPSLVHDINKDFIDTFAAGAYRCVPSHLGGTGLSKFRPSAAVGGAADSFTVAANGALPNGMLVYTRGFANAANNGIFVTSGTSVAGSIKVGTAAVLVSEPAPPANVTLDVVGVQGASGDIQINASGNLISTTLNFTTLNIPVGSWIYLPTIAEATTYMGSAAYAFANYAGRARVVSVAANLIVLERHTWTVGAADTGVGKTIRLFCASRFYRNYPIDNITSYLETTYSLEKEDIKPGDSTASRYTTARGCGVNTLQIGAPLNSKITATIGFVGMTCTTPAIPANRIAGPSTAYAALGDALVDTQNDVRDIRLTSSNATIIADVTSWTFTLNNTIKPRNSQGFFGASGLNYGKFAMGVNLTAYYQDSTAIDASDDNRLLRFDAFWANHQYGAVIDLPNVAFRNPDHAYASNEPVMISGDIVAFRNATDGIEGSLSVFGYLPSD